MVHDCSGVTFPYRMKQDSFRLRILLETGVTEQSNEVTSNEVTRNRVTGKKMEGSKILKSF